MEFSEYPEYDIAEKVLSWRAMLVIAKQMGRGVVATRAINGIIDRKVKGLH